MSIRYQPDSGDLSDSDLMPFGKHKGTPMQDVPAAYLCWLWNNAGPRSNSPVRRYIAANLDALAQEYPDGIWE